MIIFVPFSFLIVSKYALAADYCIGLNQPCNEDCECCGYPNNKDIRCDKRGLGEDKRCHMASVLSGPCLDNSQCLSQNCVGGICLPPPNPHVGRKGSLCPLGNAANVIEPVNGRLPECACNKPATNSLNAAMDGNLSTDYTNFHSKDVSGLIFNPGLKSPLREMEICTSNQHMANDPLCFSIQGECKNTGEYDLLYHGVLRLPAQRQRCVKVDIPGRLSYSSYKLILGCRRGGYEARCHAPDIVAGTGAGIDGEIEGGTGADTGTGTETETETGVETGAETGVETGTETGAETTGTETGTETGTGTESGTESGTETSGGGESSIPLCDPSISNRYLAASCQEVVPKGKDETCTPLHNRNGALSFSNFFPHSIDYDDAQDVTRHTYSFLNKIGDGRTFPDLSHAVFQYAGACCISKIRVYAIENGVEQTYYTDDSPGDHLQSPKPTVCMSGIDLPGVVGAKTYYYEFTIDGYFPRATLVDYVLKGGQYVKYSRVQGPDCTCRIRRDLFKNRLLRGTPEKRELPCVDKPVSISEVRFSGKCNEG